MLTRDQLNDPSLYSLKPQQSMKQLRPFAYDNIMFIPILFRMASFLSRSEDYFTLDGHKGRILDTETLCSCCFFHVITSVLRSKIPRTPTVHNGSCIHTAQHRDRERDRDGDGNNRMVLCPYPWPYVVCSTYRNPERHRFPTRFRAMWLSHKRRILMYCIVYLYYKVYSCTH